MQQIARAVTQAFNNLPRPHRVMLGSLSVLTLAVAVWRPYIYHPESAPIVRTIELEKSEIRSLLPEASEPIDQAPQEEEAIPQDELDDKADSESGGHEYVVSTGDTLSSILNQYGIDMGDIARLSRSSALAFRASFDGAIPPENDRYWRALVHEEFDGKSWRIHSIIRSWLQQQEHPLTQSAPLKDFINWRGPATAYRIIPEPTQQHWLYSLDYSRPDNDDALLTPAMTLYAVKVLQQKQQFPLTYFPQTRVQTELAEYQRQVNIPRQSRGL